jgi:ERCC4-type nuclease
MGIMRCDPDNILVKKSQEKKSRERPRHRWEDHIKIDLREIECEAVEWMHLAQNRVQCRELVNTVTNLRIP